MATYVELYALQNDSTLRNRVRVACLIAAEAVMAEDAGTANHANRLLWAKSVFEYPAVEAERMLMAALAANNAATVAQITGATDAQLQTVVNNHVNLFATGA